MTGLVFPEDRPQPATALPELLSALLDSQNDPVLFADTTHTVRYMNRAALAHYKQGAALLGTDLRACHNTESNRQIEAILAEMVQGLEERKITDNAKHKIFMRAVRNAQGQLLGYFERYEPPKV